MELPLRLQWTALLRGRVKASLAITGGVASPNDAVKAVVAGADAVQLVSAILKNGPGYFAAVREGLVQFMEAHQFGTVSQMTGCVSFAATMEDPAAFHRANYIRTIQEWVAART